MDLINHCSRNTARLSWRGQKQHKIEDGVGLLSFYRREPQNHLAEMCPILQDKGRTTLKVIQRSPTLPSCFQQARQWPPGAVGCDSYLMGLASLKGGTAAPVGPEGPWVKEDYCPALRSNSICLSKLDFHGTCHSFSPSKAFGMEMSILFLSCLCVLRVCNLFGFIAGEGFCHRLNPTFKLTHIWFLRLSFERGFWDFRSKKQIQQGMGEQMSQGNVIGFPGSIKDIIENRCHSFRVRLITWVCVFSSLSHSTAQHRTRIQSHGDFLAGIMEQIEARRLTVSSMAFGIWVRQEGNWGNRRITGDEGWKGEGGSLKLRLGQSDNNWSQWVLKYNWSSWRIGSL